MREITCARCGTTKFRNTGEVNRAMRLGNPLYCSRECGNKARTDRKQDTAWHHMRFTPRPNAVEITCAECGRPMWLPASKVGEYKRCGRDCNAAWRKRNWEALVRPCETCGKSFRPRQIQVANGGGRFCSQKCNPSGHLVAPENLARAQQRRREAQAAGLIRWKVGPDHHSWTGGKEAQRERYKAPEKRAQRAATLRRYRRANPERIREWRQHRGKGKVLPRLPWGTIPRLGDAQGWKCAICRCGIKGGYHVDHIMPIAKGGKHVPRNLQLLCPICNVRKSAKDPITYMQELGRLL